MFGRPQKFRSPSGSRGFRGYPNIRSLTKKPRFISSRAKVSGTVTQPMLWLINFIVSEFNVDVMWMPRYATSCHVDDYVMQTSSHIMITSLSSHVTSCHVTSCHVMSRQATLRKGHIMSRHVMSRHGTSCERLKVAGRFTRPTLHCQLTFITHN